MHQEMEYQSAMDVDVDTRGFHDDWRERERSYDQKYGKEASDGSHREDVRDEHDKEVVYAHSQSAFTRFFFFGISDTLLALRKHPPPHAFHTTSRLVSPRLQRP